MCGKSLDEKLSFPLQTLKTMFESIRNNDPVSENVSYYVSLVCHLLLIIAVFVGTFIV